MLAKAIEAHGGTDDHRHQLRRDRDLMRPDARIRPNCSEQELLAAARDGEDAAVSHLLEAHRADLRSHCTRMLGSRHDGEDALQDALLRAWRALPRFQGRSAFRSWLYRIATNACLDLMKRRSKHTLPQVGLEAGQPSPEDSYERREAAELALVAALESLPPRQRAALILRDVLGFSAKESGRALETTVASVNGALQRARRTIEERFPEQGQHAALQSLGDESTRDHAGRFLAAFERGDVEVILSLLTDEG
jgi:RNA polymerase sigma-70 factor (ECF subfamily)